MSLRMRIAARYIRWQRGKERSADEMQRAHAGRTPPQADALTRSLRRIAEVQTREVRGSIVHTLTPRAGSNGWHIVFTHGGSFVNELVTEHWDMVEQLIRATGATVTVPLYPLAPEHTHERSFALLEDVYRELCERTDKLVLCGDSAGGNLALVQALRYRDLGLRAPAHVVLFAPWMDLTMSNPEVAQVQPRDPMLWIGELVECGRWWAGSGDPRAPLLSPIHADLSGLPPIHIYQGADDVLAPDARLLRDHITAAGGRVEYHETAGAFHDFMGATFTPEARAVFRHIATVVR